MPKYTLDKHIKSIICDIEGTTTSISFVKVQYKFLRDLKYSKILKLKQRMFYFHIQEKM